MAAPEYGLGGTGIFSLAARERPSRWSGLAARSRLGVPIHRPFAIGSSEKKDPGGRDFSRRRLTESVRVDETGAQSGRTVMQRAFVIRPFNKKQDRKGKEVDFERVSAELIEPALKAAGLGGGTTGEIIEAGNIR